MHSSVCYRRRTPTRPISAGPQQGHSHPGERCPSPPPPADSRLPAETDDRERSSGRCCVRPPPLSADVLLVACEGARAVRCAGGWPIRTTCAARSTHGQTVRAGPCKRLVLSGIAATAAARLHTVERALASASSTAIRSAARAPPRSAPLCPPRTRTRSSRRARARGPSCGGTDQTKDPGDKKHTRTRSQKSEKKKQKS
jgi:hypothetical protein